MTQLYFDYSASLAFVALLLYGVVFLRYHHGIRHDMPQSNKYAFVALSLIICSVFAFASHDTYHYMEHYQEMLYYNQIVHVEKFYFWLVQALPTNYYLWRLCVWGPAALLFVFACKRYRLNANVVGLLLIAFVLDNFVITRGALGFALLLVGLSYITKPMPIKFLSYLFGAILLYLSLALHRTIGIYMIFIPLALFFSLKKGFKASVVAFPFLYVLVLGVSASLMNNPTVMSMFGETIDTYFEMEESQLNMIGQIRQVVEYAPYLLLMYFVVRNISKYPALYSKSAHFMAKYAYVLIYVSMLFFMQPISSWISSRTLHAAVFPLVICSAEYLNVNRRSKTDARILFLFIVVSLFQYVYNIYDWM